MQRIRPQTSSLISWCLQRRRRRLRRKIRKRKTENIIPPSERDVNNSLSPSEPFFFLSPAHKNKILTTSLSFSALLGFLFSSNFHFLPIFFFNLNSPGSAVGLCASSALRPSVGHTPNYQIPRRIPYIFPTLFPINKTCALYH